MPSFNVLTETVFLTITDVTYNNINTSLQSEDCESDTFQSLSEQPCE